MAAPIVTPLPAPPVRSDAPADFSSKADAFVAALPGMVTQENALAVWFNNTANGVGASVDASAASAAAALASQNAAAQSVVDAAAQVELAEDQVQLAAAQVTIATVQANNAQASAIAAESAQGSIGNLALIHALTIAL